MSKDDRADIGAVDYYAVLGVSPTSEDVVIRAAYHALMRRYHPDANSSARAASRARDLTAAYAVLSDPDERAKYDELRSAQSSPPEEPPRRRPPGFFFALGSGAALMAALGALFVTPLVPPADADRTRPNSTPPVASATATTGGSTSSPRPVSRREAADPSRVERADPRRPMPPQARPQVEVATAADRQSRSPGQPEVVRAKTAPPAAETAERKIAAAPATPARAGTEEPAPSFACRHAKSRSEKAVCESSDLATLDRSLAVLYSQSYGPAGTEKRPLLVQARERFLARRDGCNSDSCMTDAYLAHMREISDIMRRDETSR